MIIIVFAFVSLIIVLPIILFFVKQYPVIDEMKDLLDTPFVCPNCGHQFMIKMHQVWYKLPAFYVVKGFKVRCPNCKKKDICSHSHQNGKNL